MKTQEKMSDEEVKKQHPEVTSVIEIEGAKCYLKSIDRPTFEQAMGLITKTRSNPEMIRAGEVILLNCWVAGDDIIKTDDAFLIPAALQAFELMEVKTATLKKI